MQEDKSKRTDASTQKGNSSEHLALDDARRIKVLSPGMMVFKRFVRNKLAIVGFVIIVVMFLFSFVGPIFSPYAIDQKFFMTATEPGLYANGAFTTDINLLDREGNSLSKTKLLSSGFEAAALKALGTFKDKKTSEYTLTVGQEFEIVDGSRTYAFTVVSADKQRPSFLVSENLRIACANKIGKDCTVTALSSYELDEGMTALITDYMTRNATDTTLDYNGLTVHVLRQDKNTVYFSLEQGEPIAIMSYYSFTALRGRIADLQSDVVFLETADDAIDSLAPSFDYTDADGNTATYLLTLDEETGVTMLSDSNGSALFSAAYEYSYATFSETDPENPDVMRDVPFQNRLGKPNEAGDAKLDATPEDAAEFDALLKSVVLTRGDTFDFNGETYTITYSKGEVKVFNADEELCVTAVNSFTPVESIYDSLGNTFLFRVAVSEAIAAQADFFSYNGETFALRAEYNVPASEREQAADAEAPTEAPETAQPDADEDAIAVRTTHVQEEPVIQAMTLKEAQNLDQSRIDYVVTNASGEDIILLSPISYGAIQNGTVLTVDFARGLMSAMRNMPSGVTTTYEFVNQYGEVATAYVALNNGNYNVSADMLKVRLLMNGAPSTDENGYLHVLGTDNNGMDVFTRLMHGGQISLIVGFIVIFFETILGVVLGGISGYFGGWVDTLLMRFVDLFNAIPFYPIVIIIGSVMDEQRVGGWARIMLLMVIIGILGWTGIARIVRGQILSLREQDFMVATEATGIRTSRRILRHLIPNVMPLLIVNATMGLGGIILTEATLGFLGLGVKYPMASWGSIINQATDMQVMTTAWWIWIPAGIFILLTVLGFNFVGDGLRDAFDPKMKR